MANQCRKWTTAAPSRKCAFARLEFGCVLARLHRDDRILAEPAGAAGLFQDRDELGWRRGAIEHDFLALFAKNLEIARETFWRLNIGEARKLVARMIVELARVDVKVRLVLQNQRIAKRQRGMRNVMAAYVEDPGNRVRIADQQRILGPERGGGAGEFPFRFSPAILSPCRVILPSGGAGRSVQIVSIGFGSTATSSAPAAWVALARHFTWRGVCSQGS